MKKWETSDQINARLRELTAEVRQIRHQMERRQESKRRLPREGAVADEQPSSKPPKRKS